MHIYTRRSWGAGSLAGARHRIGRNSRLVVHHTASSYGATAKSTRAEEKVILRAIQKQHRSQGWIDIGYSFVIFPSGRIYTCRGWYRVPAAAVGFNTSHIHVSLVGNFEIGHTTKAAQQTLKKFARRFRSKTGNRRPALGHHQVGATACPGKHLKPIVQKLP